MPTKTVMADLVWRRIEMAGHLIVQEIDVALIIADIFSSGLVRQYKLAIRKEVPDVEYVRRVIRQLEKRKLLVQDPDFGPSALLRVTAITASPEELCCAADPFCYLSHFSAMERWGLTDRIPKNLTVTTIAPRPWKERAHRLLIERSRDIAEKFLKNVRSVQLRRISMPHNVRGRTIEVFTTTRPGASTMLKEDAVRISQRGQTFLEMLEEPELCGGMIHVIDVWSNHAEFYSDEIIAAVNGSSTMIAKVRAGYLLEERLGIKDKRIDAWVKFAQRGGSRKLDPHREYKPVFSERWCLSINV